MIQIGRNPIPGTLKLVQWSRPIALTSMMVGLAGCVDHVCHENRQNTNGTIAATRCE
jgi:hypothetical protein